MVDSTDTISGEKKKKPRIPYIKKEFMKHAQPREERKAKDVKISDELMKDLEEGRGKNRKHVDENAPKTEDQKVVENFIKNTLFVALKKTVDAAKTANVYLFKLAKRFGLLSSLDDGIYKITITKEDKNGIECTVAGENGDKKTKTLSNSQIMNTRDEKDTLFEGVTGREPGSFLEEFEYKDSCIVKITGQKRELIPPQNLLKEIEGYVNQGRGSGAFNTKRIDNIISFVTEGANEHAQGFMKEIKTIAKKEYKNPVGEKTEGLSKNQEELRNLITTFFTDPDIPIYIHKGKDIDNQAALFLLKKCPIYNRNKQVITIEQGEEKNIKVGIFLDIGETTNGIEISGKKLILSEHKKHTDEADFSNRTNSTTHMLFKILKEAHLLPQDKLDQLQRFVGFVDKVDGFNYQISGMDYQNSYRTMIGLHKALAENQDIKSVYNYFERPVNTGFERLSDDYLKKRKVMDRKGRMITLKDISEKKEKEIGENIKKFAALKEQGYELRYKGTPFIVDIKKTLEESLKDGPKVASTHKDTDGKQYGFFTIYQQKDNVYIFSPQKLPPAIAGFPTEGNFLIIPNPKEEDLDRLFKEFDTGYKSKEGLKEEIKEYNKWIQEKKKADAEKKRVDADKPNKKQEKEIEFQKALNDLPASETLNLEERMETGNMVSGIVSNTREGLGAFIQVGKKYENGQPGRGGLLHINEIGGDEALKGFKKAQRVEIFIKNIKPDGRIDFTLIQPKKKGSEVKETQAIIRNN